MGLRPLKVLAGCGGCINAWPMSGTREAPLLHPSFSCRAAPKDCLCTAAARMHGSERRSRSALTPRAAVRWRQLIPSKVAWLQNTIGLTPWYKA